MGEITTKYFPKENEVRRKYGWNCYRTSSKEEQKWSTKQILKN